MMGTRANSAPYPWQAGESTRRQPLLKKIVATIRYAAGVLDFLRHPLGPNEARESIERELATREESFLTLIERAVYARPSSPYLKLLRNAGIELQDLRRMVRADGLEATLRRLYDSGVYVTLPEFKGRQPIRRDGIEFAVSAADFDNPLLGASYVHESGGTSGAPARVYIDFDLMKGEAAGLSVWLTAHGLNDRPVAIWRPVPPDESGFKVAFRYAKLGKTVDQWFSPSWPERNIAGLRIRSFMAYTLFASRLVGRPLPIPKFVPRDKVSLVARWLAANTAAGRPAILETSPSICVRACLAAKEENLDISGTVFHIVGEPYTSGKAEVVASVAAKAVNRYAMAELGVIGLGCAVPSEMDDLHFLTNKIALITREKTVSASGTAVQSLVFTSVQRSTPKLMLSVESDDYATLSERECGCALGALGLSTHVTGIRSYEKLTSEGVTFMGSLLIELLEEVLPARFGGAPTDYQVVEEEEEGLPRVSILVAPRVGDIDEPALIDTVFRALRTQTGGELMTDQWQQGNTLRIVRREPYINSRAKILPLHILTTPSKPS